jgi:hypothetical protein
MATITSQGPLWVDNAVIADIVESQQQQAERLRPRKWLERVPTLPADDEEITAVWTQNRIAADVIAPNQAARTVAAGALEFLVAELPIIKMGAHLNQQDINRLQRLIDRRNLGTAGNDEFYLFWDNIVMERRESVRERANWMCTGLMLGSLTYDRNGVQFTVTFNRPADASVPAALAWGTNPTTATPITDINNQANYLALTYGFRPNRVTLTRADFLNLVATTQVKNLSQALIGIPATNAINTANLPLMQNYIGTMLGGFTVEIDDSIYRTEEADGTVTSHPVQPVGTAILTDSGLDGDRRYFDFANAPLTENIVARLTGDTDAGLSGQERGPAVFATCPPDYNPPEITVWGVQRGFPRPRQKVYSGLITGL